MNETDQNAAKGIVPPSAPTPAASPAHDDRLREDVKAFTDGQLGWWRQQVVKRHLARCAECREEMQAMRDFSAKWRQADDDVLDPGLRARILAAVPDTVPSSPQAALGGRAYRRPLALVGALTSTALFAGVAVSLFGHHANRLDTAAPAAMRSATNDAGIAASAPSMTDADKQSKVALETKSESAAAPNSAASVATPTAPGGAAKQSQIASANIAPGAADERAQAERNFRARDSAAAAVSAPPAPSLSPKTMPADITPLPLPPTPLQDRVSARKASVKEKARVGAGKSDAEHTQEHKQEAAASANASAPGNALPGSNARAASPAKPNSTLRRVPAPTELTLEVGEVEAAGAEIEKDVENAGGSIVNSGLTTGAGTKSARLLVKIPAARLNAFLAQVAQRNESQAAQAKGEADSGGGPKPATPPASPAVAQDSSKQASALVDVIIHLKGKDAK